MSFLFGALTREECEAIREEDGYLRGLDDGKAMGLAQGQQESQYAIARNMLDEDVDHSLILKVTGISESELMRFFLIL